MQNNPVDESLPNGVVMQDGKMMKVNNGKMTILDYDMTMSNGTRIRSDGSYIKKDGNKMMMKDGQHMDMEGKITLIKAKSKNMYLVPDSMLKKD